MGKTKESVAELSPTQRMICDLLVAGKSRQGVAMEMGISMGTLNSHLMIARLRLGYKTNGEMIAAMGGKGVGPRGRSVRADHQSVLDSEKRVVDLLAEGMEAREVAETLGLSYYTVRSYMNMLRMRFGCRNITELVAKLVRKEVGELLHDRETDLEFEYNTRVAAEERLRGIPFDEISDMLEYLLEGLNGEGARLRTVAIWLRRVAPWAIAEDGLLIEALESDEWP